MSHAIDPVRPSDPAASAVGGSARVPPRPAAPSLFDLAMAPPRIEAGGSALRRAAWPFFAAGSPRAISTPAFAPTVLAPLRDAIVPAVLRDAAQDALLDAADRVALSPSRYAAMQDFVAPHDMPSRNAPSAHSDMRKTLLARDEGGDPVTLDLHVAKLSESRWEAAAFDRADAARTGAFPYAAAPLAVTTFGFDAQAGRFVLPEIGRMLQLVPPAPTRSRRMPWALCCAAVLVAGTGMLFFARVFA